MTEVVKVSLENEMDLTLAYKKTIKAAELLGLTLSTQTAFATAVSEVSREVIDKTYDGMAVIGVETEGQRYTLTASISYRPDANFKGLEDSYQYARKLVPFLEVTQEADREHVKLQLGIPRTAKLNKIKVEMVKHYFETEGPTSAYEEVKLKNMQLARLTEEQEMLLKQSKFINEQKNEFLSVASHELKNPLTIIKAYAQMARISNEAPTPLIAGYIEKIEMQSMKLHSLVQQLFDISKIESGQFDYRFEPVNMSSFLAETLELIQYTVPGYDLRLNVIDNRYAAIIDRIRIEQVLANIIGNAAKYSPKGSPVEVDALIKDDDQLVISVRDYGIGMNADAMANMFEKFYRSEEVLRKYTGLGMGLYIASKIVSDHGGRIWAESEQGKGSVFFFSLPVKNGQAVLHN